ncbi:hypothetical protein O181_005373 [Austropuccinia psidii MF-1]|uniref:Myb-like domain-containing protein n=1 Tax=Austropuccinia psidii MF-1 TaxID=1389203 RepID=A0A9Q3BID9_9BASI|nr:hypothetical protein [Austropuccinia psidii MF-1]
MITRRQKAATDSSLLNSNTSQERKNSKRNQNQIKSSKIESNNILKDQIELFGIVTDGFLKEVISVPENQRKTFYQGRSLTPTEKATWDTVVGCKNKLWPNQTYLVQDFSYHQDQIRIIHKYNFAYFLVQTIENPDHLLNEFIPIFLHSLLLVDPITINSNTINEGVLDLIIELEVRKLLCCLRSNSEINHHQSCLFTSTGQAQVNPLIYLKLQTETSISDLVSKLHSRSRRIQDYIVEAGGNLESLEQRFPLTNLLDRCLKFIYAFYPTSSPSKAQTIRPVSLADDYIQRAQRAKSAAADKATRRNLQVSPSRLVSSGMSPNLLNGDKTSDLQSHIAGFQDRHHTTIAPQSEQAGKIYRKLMECLNKDPNVFGPKHDKHLSTNNSSSITPKRLTEPTIESSQNDRSTPTPIIAMNTSIFSPHGTSSPSISKGSSSKPEKHMLPGAPFCWNKTQEDASQIEFDTPLSEHDLGVQDGSLSLQQGANCDENAFSHQSDDLADISRYFNAHTNQTDTPQADCNQVEQAKEDQLQPLLGKNNGKLVAPSMVAVEPHDMQNSSKSRTTNRFLSPSSDAETSSDFGRAGKKRSSRQHAVYPPNRGHRAQHEHHEKQSNTWKKDLRSRRFICTMDGQIYEQSQPKAAGPKLPLSCGKKYRCPSENGYISPENKNGPDSDARSPSRMWSSRKGKQHTEKQSDRVKHQRQCSDDSSSYSSHASGFAMKKKHIGIQRSPTKRHRKHSDDSFSSSSRMDKSSKNRKSSRKKRTAWTWEETELLIEEVEKFYEEPNCMAIILRRHGRNGTVSETFANRTSVMLKDKAVHLSTTWWKIKSQLSDERKKAFKRFPAKKNSSAISSDNDT